MGRVCGLTHNLAIHYFYLEDYNKALETENIVYTETKDSLGEKHLSTLMALDSIAIYCSKVGDYKKGLKLQNQFIVQKK
ncbi:tetratricopeptide repeat protein [Catenibacterium mitsuokai]|uniref:tetratricopeptide repeat protein n=1 Tax=Catenibacterium mitsuokai TaxID=100886 RepID=UPI003F8B3F41